LKINQSIIITIKERCKTCYTCVRECPAKAIRISGGQAEVINERCIKCGNCVKVCRQAAKQYHNAVNDVIKLLDGNDKVAAIIAPSFAAEFLDISFMKLVGMLRAAGFAYVNEVSFGADLIAKKTNEMVAENNGKHYITTTCPAAFEYVRRFHPNLIPYLQPIVSPMIATARVLKEIHGNDLKIVFIGPCTAKKAEISSDELWGEINEAITFAELRKLFREKFIIPDSVIANDFDAPHGQNGSLFPISRGMLQSAGIVEDLVSGDIVSADGKNDFIEAIKEFESDDLHAKLVDVLCCNGCIMGAGMTTYAPIFQRRSRVSRYVRQVVSQRDIKEWESYIQRFSKLDLSREFKPFDQRLALPKEEDVRRILAELGKSEAKDELNCGACGYETCREHAIAIYQGLAEDKMCLPYSIEQLSKTIEELDLSNEQLASTREALRQSEKLATMGQLAAGIAHELNNPLGVVLMYAHLLNEEAESDSPLRNDIQIITQEADRCKKIVSGLLNFSRKNKLIINKANINELVDQCFKLIQVPENVTISIIHEIKGITAEVDKDQLIQVINNLATNAITAMPEGGALTIETKLLESEFQIIVSDSGFGIPEQNMKKVFEPFFTTKKIGQGTGLGLAVSYGIIKMHKGQINVNSNANPDKGPTGTKFIVTLPLKNEL
jgi:signal transduction histidine kinase/iron only hydrogenase large subunit-like protein